MNTDDVSEATDRIRNLEGRMLQAEHIITVLIATNLVIFVLSVIALLNFQCSCAEGHRSFEQSSHPQWDERNFNEMEFYERTGKPKRRYGLVSDEQWRQK